MSLLHFQRHCKAVCITTV